MLTIDRLRRLDDEGWITVRPLDDLIICNYTAKCLYDAHWDEATTRCRGLILRVDRPWPESTHWTEVVALPFDKFFEVGERNRQPTGELVEVTEKVDGSLGVLYRHKGQYRVASRGAFQSEMALWATDFLRKNYDLRGLPSNLTLLFEIIYPENRVVIDYKQTEDLVLIGVRDRFNGDDFPFSTVRGVAHRYDFSLPDWHHDMIDLSLAELQQMARDLDGTREGWVLRFSDGTRWKLKGKRYRELARLIQGLSPKAVLETMIEGTCDALLDGLPPEYLQVAREWRREWLYKQLQKQSALYTAYQAAPKGTRKEFALWAAQRHKLDMHYLFAMLDGQDVAPMIYEAMLKGVHA